MDRTPQDIDPEGTDKLLSLLGEQYKPLEKVVKETFDFLGNEKALYFTNIFNDWIDIGISIRDTYTRDELSNSLLYCIVSARMVPKKDKK